MYLPFSKSPAADLCRLEVLRRVLHKASQRGDPGAKPFLSRKLSILGEEIVLMEEIPILSFILLLFIVALFL